jgi:hypothetical protein
MMAAQGRSRGEAAMSPFMKSIAAVAAGVLALAAAVAAHAFVSGTGIVVVNDYHRPMVQFFVGQRQMLGQPVGPGQSVIIDAGDGRCNVVVAAVFDDGMRQSSPVNVCAIAQYPATARGIPNCPGDPRCKGANAG